MAPEGSKKTPNRVENWWTINMLSQVGAKRFLGAVREWKNALKVIPEGSKTSPNGGLGRPRARFLRFWEALEENDFFKILWSGKSWSKICKNTILGGEWEFPGQLLGGSAQGAWLLEGVSRVVRILHEFRHWVLHAHAPASRGRRILMAPPYPPTPKIWKNIKIMNSN